MSVRCLQRKRQHGISKLHCLNCAHEWPASQRRASCLCPYSCSKALRLYVMASASAAVWCSKIENSCCGCGERMVGCMWQLRPLASIAD